MKGTVRHAKEDFIVQSSWVGTAEALPGESAEWQQGTDATAVCERVGGRGEAVRIHPGSAGASPRRRKPQDGWAEKEDCGRGKKRGCREARGRKGSCWGSVRRPKAFMPQELTQELHF